MAVEDIRQRVRSTLEGLMTAEEASYLMDRPPGGWSDLMTKDFLRAELADLRTEMANLRTQLDRQTTSMLRWLVPTVCAAVVASAALT